jgi:hypothetical protein
MIFNVGILGINITAYVLRLFRTRQLQFTFYAYGITKDTFQEVYCMLNFDVGFLFDSFEQYWSSQPKPPSMMDFNGLFKTFQMTFEIHLLQKRNVFIKPRPMKQFKIKMD